MPVVVSSERWDSTLLSQTLMLSGGSRTDWSMLLYAYQPLGWLPATPQLLLETLSKCVCPCSCKTRQDKPAEVILGFASAITQWAIRRGRRPRTCRSPCQPPVLYLSTVISVIQNDPSTRKSWKSTKCCKTNAIQRIWDVSSGCWRSTSLHGSTEINDIS